MSGNSCLGYIRKQNKVAHGQDIGMYRVKVLGFLGLLLRSITYGVP